MAAPKTKIFVGHLPDGCRTEDLQALFEKYGVVKECDVINKYGFVHMSNVDEANEAIKNLNNYNFKGSSISVEPSKSKIHLEPGTSGRAKPRSSDRNGFGPTRGHANGYRSGPYRTSSRDLYYDRPFGLGGDRLRPYPSPYDRRSPLPMLPEDYMRRLPPPGTTDPYARSGDLYTRASDLYGRSSDLYGRSGDPYGRSADPYARVSDPYARVDPYSRPSDPYARPIPSLTARDELYERRSLLERSDYLYSRRSPPSLSSLSRSYWYGDLERSARPLPSSTAATRRIPAFY